MHACFFVSTRLKLSLFSIFFGPVFIHLEISQPRRWREFGCEGGEMEGCSWTKLMLRVVK